MNAPGQSSQKKMTGNEIRRSFVEFFARNGHRVVPSSSLVPAGDPTLLFTNAGMNQFKDVFLGLEQRDYKRAVTVQKCVRAGGKHNDLENVGRTARHQTFFEMLGNFSFGDYFKKEAIAFAWELVAKEWAVPTDKLYFTVFGGAEVAPGNKLGVDEESKALWKSQGAATDRVFTIPGLKDNFWAMGDTGPCGPCSEIFHDFGPMASDLGHKDCKFPCECGRYVEIWNLVFMQFNRDAEGKLNALPKPSVDTGAGLERVAAVLEGKISNYDTDLLRPLIDFASDLSGKPYGENADMDVSLRILADHSRAGAFLVSDGVLPSNEGRGYVLRKIIRRAIGHGQKLGLDRPFMFEMASSVADLMQEAYPELLAGIDRVATIIKHEEIRFKRTVAVALEHFKSQPVETIEALEQLPKAASLLPHSGGTGRRPVVVYVKDVDANRLPAAEADGEYTLLVQGEAPLRIRTRAGFVATLHPQAAFKLFDTFGLPLDLLREVAEERGIWIDEQAFNEELEKQRERAKASWKGAHKEAARPVYTKLAETFRTEPDFYYSAATKDCRIEAIVTKNGLVNEIAAGAEAEVVLDRTVFYAEAGGQVADIGSFMDNGMSLTVAEVRGAYYPVAGLIAHRITAKETLRVGDRVALAADGERREHIKRNHTGTHLLHAALRNILGTHVKQAGSLVAPDRLRFDFVHFSALIETERGDVERLVNEAILKNEPVSTSVRDTQEAMAAGAVALFGEKYGDRVRVVSIGDGRFSTELCGGTHVLATGEIGTFLITGESGVAAGIRRIESLTGLSAVQFSRERLDEFERVRSFLNAKATEVDETVRGLLQTFEKKIKSLEQQLAKAHSKQVGSGSDFAKKFGNVTFVVRLVEDASSGLLSSMADEIRSQLPSGIVFLAGKTPTGGVTIVSSVTPDIAHRVSAGDMVRTLAPIVGGKGGGRPTFAEAGGKDPSRIPEMLLEAQKLVEKLLS